MEQKRIPLSPFAKGRNAKAKGESIGVGVGVGTGEASNARLWAKGKGKEATVAETRWLQVDNGAIHFSHEVVAEIGAHFGKGGERPAWFDSGWRSVRGGFAFRSAAAR